MKTEVPAQIAPQRDPGLLLYCSEIIRLSTYHSRNFRREQGNRLFFRAHGPCLASLRNSRIESPDRDSSVNSQPPGVSSDNRCCHLNWRIPSDSAQNLSP